MFNNINDNDYLYNSQLEKQNNVIDFSSICANMQRNAYAKTVSPYIDKSEISSGAIKLFQRDCDINKFNQIAMSDVKDYSYLNQMKELFSNGVIDVYEDDVLSSLVTNSKLLGDLEL